MNKHQTIFVWVEKMDWFYCIVYKRNMNAILYLGNLGGRFTLRFFERRFGRMLVMLGSVRVACITQWIDLSTAMCPQHPTILLDLKPKSYGRTSVRNTCNTVFALFIA